MLPPDGTQKETYKQGTVFGPVEMVVQDQSHYGSFVAVMITGYTGEKVWVNVWCNRNKKGILSGTDYAYPCNEKGVLYPMERARGAQRDAAAKADAARPAIPKAQPFKPPQKAKPPTRPTVPIAEAKATAVALPSLPRMRVEWSNPDFRKLLEDPTRALEDVLPNGRWYTLQAYNACDPAIRNAFKCLTRPGGPTHFLSKVCRHDARYSDRVDAAILACDIVQETRSNFGHYKQWDRKMPKNIPQAFARVPTANPDWLHWLVGINMLAANPDKARLEVFLYDPIDQLPPAVFAGQGRVVTRLGCSGDGRLKVPNDVLCVHHNNIIAIRAVGGHSVGDHTEANFPSRGWERISSDVAPYMWHGTSAANRQKIIDAGILAGGPNENRFMSFFSPNVPLSMGSMNAKVLRPTYVYAAELYICVDVAMAEQEGVNFWYGHQGAVMTRQTIPSNCFVYLSQSGQQTTIDGNEYNDSLTANPRPVLVDPASHRKPAAEAKAPAAPWRAAEAQAAAAPWRSAVAKASAWTGSSPRGSVGSELAATKAPAVQTRMVFLDDSKVAQSVDEMLREFAYQQNKEINVNNRYQGHAQVMAKTISNIQTLVAPSPDDAVIVEPVAWRQVGKWQRSVSSAVMFPAPHAPGQDPIRSGCRWSGDGISVMVDIPGVDRPLVICRVHVEDLDYLRHKLERSTSWESFQLKQLLYDLRAWVRIRIGPDGGDVEANSTVIALSNYYLNASRAPLHKDVFALYEKVGARLLSCRRGAASSRNFQQ